MRDLFGDRLSQLTLLLFLDEDYEGGNTTFSLPGPVQSQRVGVRVPRGGALLFFHGEHPRSLLHEVSLVHRGVKRIIRTDVLYPMKRAEL